MNEWLFFPLARSETASFCACHAAAIKDGKPVIVGGELSIDNLALVVGDVDWTISDKVAAFTRSLDGMSPAVAAYISILATAHFKAEAAYWLKSVERLELKKAITRLGEIARGLE